jgi:hypothetical protein
MGLPAWPKHAVSDENRAIRSITAGGRVSGAGERGAGAGERGVEETEPRQRPFRPHPSPLPQASGLCLP